eukprot:Skav207615  [mRNA]  locus=scaffold1878:101822:111291:+ [translate_table: standard]
MLERNWRLVNPELDDKRFSAALFQMSSGRISNCGSKTRPKCPEVAMAESEAVAELFCCGICEDLMLAPITLVCCGRSFCKEFLRLWIKTNAQQGGIPRCPGGCMQKVPFRLPPHSISLRKAMEQLVPERLAIRMKEAEEEELDDCLGGFKAWGDIAASRDILLLSISSSIIVRQGSPGLIVGNCEDGCHLTVKFDQREDGSELCVNVVPEALMLPLPGGFRLRQKVVVHAGCRGTVLAEFSDTRLTVVFETSEESPSCFNVLPLEILPWCELPSHMPAGSSVKATQHLMSPCAIIVHAGTKGTILGGVDQSLVFVSFENGPAVAAAINTLEQLEEHEEHEKLEPEDVSWVNRTQTPGILSEQIAFGSF